MIVASFAQAFSHVDVAMLGGGLALAVGGWWFWKRK
jgi:LPXTG-motif cell wall-anchored protein